MDLETENRIASILMKEAAELRRQAEEEGVHAYLRKPNVRFRPNSRFLTATVLGVQQANRVTEVNEMWRVRKKEREVDDDHPGSNRDKKYSDSPRSTRSDDREHNGSVRSSGTRYRDQNSHIPSSSKADFDESCSSRDGGWKDEEVEQFLHSRVKRGRGGVGARMDEPGPYLPRSDSDYRSKISENPDIREKEEWERRVLGPEKPQSIRSNNSSSEDDEDEGKWKKAKRVKLESPKKHSKKHRRREEKHAHKEKKDGKHKHIHKRGH